MPTVFVLLRSFHHLCSDWVQMYVPDQFAEIFVSLTHYGPVSTLKQVPDLLVLAVMVLAVRCEHSLHNATNRVILHLDQQVKMIRHQAICVEEEGSLRLLLTKNIREPQIVFG